MRIGLLTTYLAIGEDTDSGIGQHFRILADALVVQGHQVHVVFPTQRSAAATAALAELSPRWTFEVVPVRIPLWLDRALGWSWPSRVLLAEICAARAANRALRRAVRDHALEIIETHATAAPGLLYLRRRERPAMVTRVSTTMSQMNLTSPIHSRVKDWQALIERIAVRASDALITHTAMHRDAVCAIDGYKPWAFTIIPHGLPDVSPLPTDTRARPDSEILFVGRFDYRKGIDVLLAAIPAVLAVCPHARFKLVGSQGDGLAWKKFTDQHPALVGKQVIATGHLTAAELDAQYACCDIFVAPSRYESFGLIYVEAMRRAKPVIGCAVGGISEVVTDGATGLLARSGDVDSLVDCLVRLIADPALRARLGQAGREDFCRRFSAAQMASASVEFYQCVLTARRKVAK